MRERTRESNTQSGDPETSKERDTNESVDADGLKTEDDLDNKYDESLFRALYRTFITRIWVAGVLKLISGMADSYLQILHRNYWLISII
jgi:hypothetical protein